MRCGWQWRFRRASSDRSRGRVLLFLLLCRKSHRAIKTIICVFGCCRRTSSLRYQFHWRFRCSFRSPRSRAFGNIVSWRFSKIVGSNCRAGSRTMPIRNTANRGIVCNLCTLYRRFCRIGAEGRTCHCCRGSVPFWRVRLISCECHSRKNHSSSRHAIMRILSIRMLCYSRKRLLFQALGWMICGDWPCGLCVVRRSTVRNHRVSMRVRWGC